MFDEIARFLSFSAKQIGKSHEMMQTPVKGDQLQLSLRVSPRRKPPTPSEHVVVVDMSAQEIDKRRRSRAYLGTRRWDVGVGREKTLVGKQRGGTKQTAVNTTRKVGAAIRG